MEKVRLQSCRKFYKHHNNTICFKYQIKLCEISVANTIYTRALIKDMSTLEAKKYAFFMLFWTTTWFIINSHCNVYLKGEC